MYHPIQIEPLSASQRSKIIRGHPVRVKHGRGIVIHASPEQHKKIMRAHGKGQAHTITFDPYQAEQHGCGLMGDLAKAAVHYVKGHIKANIPQAEKFVRAEIQKYGKRGQAMAENKLESLGLSPELSHQISEEATGRLVKGAEHLSHAGFHHAKKMLGEGIHKKKRKAPLKKGGKVLSIKDIGKKIKSGFQKLGHDLKPVGNELQKFARQNGREILHAGINYGLTPALASIGAASGQPELVAAAPVLKTVGNKGVDMLGDKYGFGFVGGKGGKRKMYYGTALYPP